MVYNDYMEYGNKTGLKVLYLEDNPYDVELVTDKLKSEFQIELTHVNNKEDFLRSLSGNKSFDIILSDYSLPTITAETSLQLAKKFRPELPFICLSGTIGDDVAVELLKRGANDYVLKDRMTRLNSCVIRSIKEVHEARLLTEAQDSLKKQFLELKEAKEKAEESDRLKTAFLANLSHEIRTPMNGIIGFAELLKNEEIKSEEQQNYAQIIQKSSERMLRIIHDLIDISKIESNQMNLVKSNFNLMDVFEEVQITFSLRLKEKGLSLSIKCEMGNKDAVVFADKTRIIQVLTNLVDNGIKNTERGSIIISCKRKSNEFIISVSDTGKGIEPSMHEIIFQRFRQVEEKESDFTEGSGLGLAISKAIVEMHNGKIGVDSLPGKGATFYFTLPVFPGHP